MTSLRLNSVISRRSTLLGFAASGLGLALAAHGLQAAAQDATPEGATPSAPTPSDPLRQWAPGQTATINGAALYYEDHGDPNGQPVLLLHGGLLNTEWWANLAPVLVAAGYRVVAMDSRGHGRSAWGDKPITVVPQMADDALGLLDHLGIPKADVVGWSDGAVIALDLAIHHPERLDRVVAYGANFTPDGLHDLVPTDELPPFERLIADYRRLAPEPERFEELAGVLDAQYKVAPNYSEAQLGSIGVPVLVLDGAEEEFIKPEHTRRLAELIPGATLVFIPGAGHFAPFAKPAVFNQIVLDYLAGRTPGMTATPTAGTPTP